MEIFVCLAIRENRTGARRMRAGASILSRFSVSDLNQDGSKKNAAEVGDIEPTGSSMAKIENKFVKIPSYF